MRLKKKVRLGHINVQNHVVGALQSYAGEFQHTWRDYSIVILLVVVLGACLLGCCYVTVIYIYRRLLFQLLRRTPVKPVRAFPDNGQSSGPVYMIT
jgi:hypothetical protein